MRFLFILLLLSLVSTIQSQVLIVSFQDAKTNEPIPNVQCKIGFLSTEFGSIKDTLSGFSLQNGQISFALKTSKPGNNNAKSNIEFQLDYSHPIYQSASKLYSFELKEDTTKLNLYLKAERIQEVRDVVVKSNKPDTVYASKTYSVSDFELGANGELFLLTYEKNLMKDAQLQCIWKDTTLFLQEIPERAEALKRDFRGNVHVLTETNMYGLQRTDAALQLGSIPKDYFYKYIAPIVDTSLTRQFYSSYIDIYPAFEYGALDQLDSTYKAILHIQDDLMMELYRSEYKWVDIRTKLWAKNLENQTGIDAEIYVGANVFTQSLYYEPVYAPLFLSKDTLYIFDYPKDMLRVYTSDGRLLKSIPIFHHYHAKQSGFQKNLQQDRKTGNIYTIYEQEGHVYVGLLDLKTGLVVQKVKLAFRYVEKVRIYDNQVYFVYRPFESTQKKFLYKQKLPTRDN
jgi:hypothetical protein